MFVSNVDISSLTNKILNHFNTGMFSCQMQGSHLMVKKNYKSKPESRLVKMNQAHYITGVFYHKNILAA